jgi:squalene-associated FAD-dependent desaturase
MRHVHVIGAGLAGLSAALSLTAAGRGVTLHEAGPAAGGRCRSYFDRELGIRIDNGNHLLLSGNKDAFAFIAEIESTALFSDPKLPVFPFMDIKSGERWRVRPNLGRIPWWILAKNRRVPDTRLADYFAMRDIGKIKGDKLVTDAMRRGKLYWRLVEPLAVAALNTRPQAGLARLLGAVMRETLLKGGKFCIPRFPTDGLSEALIDPAVAKLHERGAEVRLSSRVNTIRVEGGRVASIGATGGQIDLGPDDAVVLAVPPWAATDLLPGVTAPDQFEAILNLHYKLDADPEGPLAETGFLGVLSGTAEWIFAKKGHISVTVSAANERVDDSADDLSAVVWLNVRDALNLPVAMDREIPPYRVVKERRATFAATPAQERRRPDARTNVPNLVLAGDWTNTGLPATIEGAIRSGRTAARLLLAG